MKQLVLLGSGPSHLKVLRELAQAPLPGVQVTLVAPSSRALFAGMLPGWVAGRYTLDDCTLPLAPLADAARAERVESAVTALDAAQRRLQLADGRTLHYEALSLDTEPTMAPDAITGARKHAVFTCPAEPFLWAWETLYELALERTLSVVVIGSGVAAVEFAVAVQTRLASHGRVVLVTGAGVLLPSHASALRSRVVRSLKRQKIALFEDRCTAITANQVQLEQGLRLGCDAPLMALEQGVAPRWLAESGLVLDEQGFVRRRDTLQSLSHAEVFVAGASLALNLRRFMAGGDMVAVRSRPPAWTLLACDAQHGIAGWGPLALEGRWVRRWKERRERGAVVDFAAPCKPNGR